MRYIIPTHGRVGRQVTYDRLPPDIQEQVTFVVQDCEAHLWRGVGVRLAVLPLGITTIGPTRQWINENFDGKICVLDDDIRFATRGDGEETSRTKFVLSTHEEMREMFSDIETALDDYVHVGVSPREGANHRVEDVIKVYRAIRVHGIDATRAVSLGARYDRTNFMVDFDFTLQLLRMGHPNIILNNWVHNQGGSNTPGGCSTTRTLEELGKAADRLAELHEGFVRVSIKKTKSEAAWGGGERKDVTVYWKKAYKSSGV